MIGRALDSQCSITCLAAHTPKNERQKSRCRPHRRSDPHPPPLLRCRCASWSGVRWGEAAGAPDNRLAASIQHVCLIRDFESLATCSLHLHKIDPVNAPFENRPVPNFTRLDSSRPEIAILMDAMLRAREVVAARSWSTPHEPTSENWWADVLADPRARIRRQPRGFYVVMVGERLGNPITGLQTSPVQ